MMKLNNKKGFTLIELLVVVAIIGTLSGIVMQTLSTARQKARDANRKTQLKEVQIALEHYFTSKGMYPSTLGVWLSSENGDSAGAYNSDWIPNLVAQKMIASLPNDPVGGLSPLCTSGQYRAYLYRSDGSNYKLLSNCALEQSASYPTSGNDPFYDPKRSSPLPAWAIQVSNNPNVTATW